MIELGRQKIKYIKSLALKKYRQKYNKFILEGQKILTDVPEIHEHRIEKIYYVKEQFSEDLHQRFTDRYLEIDKKSMKLISAMTTPPGCLAIANAEDFVQKNENTISGRCLFLEDINIPGNLGTILRTADWFGFDKIFISPDSVDLFNPKVIQASMGAIWNLTFGVVQLSEMKISDGDSIFGTVMNGKDYRAIHWPESFLLVLGNESRGISQDSLKLCTDSIGILGRSQSVADSLNVAVSAAIIMSSVK